jgi:hypothetical protein
VGELARVHGPAVGDDGALLAFLWAEATDVIEPGSGLTVLEQARIRTGDHALVSVAIAERQLARGELDQALEHLQIAVNGNLLGLRSRGKVALAGAEAALRSNLASVAERMLAIAENEADTRAMASAMRSEMEGQPVPRAPSSLVLAEADEDEEVEPLPHPTEMTERTLREALAQGDVRAGDALAHQLGGSPEHSGEIVKIRQTQLDLKPGDERLLTLLRQAALDDRNYSYARAIDHVLRAFDAGAGAVDPPPLVAQHEQPGIRTLLMKPSLGPSGESLALVWDGAGNAFVRTPDSYGITGVERVAPGPTSVISRLYEIALRLLDVSVPLYLRRAQQMSEGRKASEPRLVTGLAMPRPSVALFQAPAALLTGEVREEAPPICYALGQAIASALPHNALMIGMPEAQARAVWQAIVVSFGPTASARSTMPESAKYTTLFWSTIPGRLQRRIQQILGGSAPSYEEVAASALQSTRRIGLFLAGDIATAVRAFCMEPQVQRAAPKTPAELGQLCAEVPEVADLVRLAIRTEYADARWTVPPDGSSRVKVSSGGHRVK